MRRVARVACKRRGPNSDALLTFEVLLNGERIERGRSYIGFYRAGSVLLPFFLHMDGRIDFGSEWDDRYSATNFFDHSIRIGELFTVEELDENDRPVGRTYEITEIATLLAAPEQ